MRVVKSFNQEGEQVNKFSAASDDLNRLNLNIGYLMSAVIPAFSIIAYIAICAVTTMIGLQIKLHPTDCGYKPICKLYFDIIICCLDYRNCTYECFSGQSFTWKNKRSFRY